MFVKYQSVRNVFLIGGLAALGGVIWISCGNTKNEDPKQHDYPSRVATGPEASSPPTGATRATPQPDVQSVEIPPKVAPPVVRAGQPNPANELLERYRTAMRIALGPADASGKGKDVLGPKSPWKLNLYDDDKDGRYDRGKLDYDRDDVDDEKWNFKKGRWEKNGGAKIWDGSTWIQAGKNDASTPLPKAETSVVEAPPAAATTKGKATDPMLERYRAAMRIAQGPADASGKGKDVLGPKSTWKLNLYDDDKDGRYDRGKLDYDRDEVDDEKWNFKNGRWEKDGGAKIWNGSDWIEAR